MIALLVAVKRCKQDRLILQLIFEFVMTDRF